MCKDVRPRAPQMQSSSPATHVPPWDRTPVGVLPIGPTGNGCSEHHQGSHFARAPWQPAAAPSTKTRCCCGPSFRADFSRNNFFHNFQTSDHVLGRANTLHAPAPIFLQRLRTVARRPTPATLCFPPPRRKPRPLLSTLPPPPPRASCHVSDTRRHGPNPTQPRSCFGPSVPGPRCRATTGCIVSKPTIARGRAT